MCQEGEFWDEQADGDMLISRQDLTDGFKLGQVRDYFVEQIKILKVWNCLNQLCIFAYISCIILDHQGVIIFNKGNSENKLNFLTKAHANLS